jgi:hypothetical protein
MKQPFQPLIHTEGGIHPAPGFSPATGGAEAPRGLKAALRVRIGTRPGPRTMPLIRILLVGCLAFAVPAYPAQPDPAVTYRQALENQVIRSGDSGEAFCWHARVYMSQLWRGYGRTKDTAWLDWNLKYFDFLVSRMLTGPDGYKGWIGTYMYDSSVWADSHVGDALLAEGMLEFAEAVLQDPGLRDKYGAAAERYLKLARVDVFEKWDARGTWHEDGAVGAYNTWNQFADPGNKNWRVDSKIKNALLTHPFNKQNDMGILALRLYRITGEERFRRRAEQVFAYQKSRFQYFDNHCVWNYWEPFGAWDLNLEKRAARHWIGVHPYRNYQEREVAQMVEAYHSGIVFDKADIERILRTNLEMMWNGDRANPKFRNSDVTRPGYVEAAPMKGEGRAGALWPALGDFSQTVRDLSGRASAGAPSFERRLARWPARVVEFPVHECRGLSMAAALPGVVAAGESTVLTAKPTVPGSLEIAVYRDGVRREILHSADVPAGLFLLPWKPKAAGDYVLRWSFGDGYREFAVRVRPSESALRVRLWGPSARDFRSFAGAPRLPPAGRPALSGSGLPSRGGSLLPVGRFPSQWVERSISE